MGFYLRARLHFPPGQFAAAAAATGAIMATGQASSTVDASVSVPSPRSASRAPLLPQPAHAPAPAATAAHAGGTESAARLSLGPDGTPTSTSVDGHPSLRPSFIPGSGWRSYTELRRWIFARLANARAHLESSPDGGLPELTNRDGAPCRDSCTSQAWSSATLMDALYDLHVAATHWEGV